MTIRFVMVILIPCVSVLVLAATTLRSQPGKITMTNAELASLFSNKAAKDPLADPALSPSAHPHNAAATPGGNTPAGNPSSMAGASTQAGMGSGIGGTSTGSSSAGGGSAGGSGGGASGTVNQLNTLGIQGAFAGTVTVHYATNDNDADDGTGQDTDQAPSGETDDGTAVPGVDYTPTSGDLTFVGDQTLTFTVPLKDDKEPDGLDPLETIPLSLSNPSGAALGLKDATLTLLEDNGTLAWQGGPAFSWSQSPPVAPSIVTPSDQVNTEGDNVSLGVIASGPLGDLLTYDAVGLPPGLSINSATGVMSGTVDYSAAEDFNGSYTPTVIVANGLGGSASTSLAWTITPDTRTPVLTTPGDQTSAVGDSVSLPITTSQPHGQLIYNASGNRSSDLGAVVALPGL